MDTFRLRIVSSKLAAAIGREVEVAGGSATIGRSMDATLVLNDPGVSRVHARLELTPEGVRLTDNNSANGVWLGTERVTNVLLVSGQQFRIGESLMECLFAAPEEVEAPTVFVRAGQAPPVPDPAAVGADGRPPQPPAPILATPPPPPRRAPAMTVPPTEPEAPSPTMLARRAATTPLAGEGEKIVARGSHAIVLDDPQRAWYVVSGWVDLFTVALKDGKPSGARTHFLSVEPGQCFFGMDLAAYAVDSGFLAVAYNASELRQIPLARLAELAAGRASEDVAGAVEAWVVALARRLTKDIVPRPLSDVTLTAGAGLSLPSRKRARAGDSLLWLDIPDDVLLYIGMEYLVYSEEPVLFPLTPETWVETTSDEAGELKLSPRRTAAAVRDAGLWRGLALFHQTLCQCEFINKKLAEVDEFNRLQSKAKYSEAAKEAAYDEIGSVLAGAGVRPREAGKAGDSEPVFRACELVGEAAGVKVKKHPDAKEARTFEENLNAVAVASRFRTRSVVLRDDWWAHDQGPLLGQIEATKAPVALLPTGVSSYVLVDPRTGQRAPVTARLAETLAPFAHTFYRPFPDGPLGVKELALFGARGLKRDVLMLAVMGVALGLLGSLTPYFTGQVFDSAIPQAERGALVQFGLALFVSALTSMAFRITQSVAMLRIQGRMDYSIQAALWDRLLDLPSRFFRTYQSGDLADRAAGIDAIRSLVAGAGVSAILGSLSGLFYVGLMLTYDFSLAALAIGLTVVLVLCSAAANLAQLGHQRRQLDLAGKIGGLVLQLINGVPKLKVAGAEHHAFRVWARGFAEQRRVALAAGKLQATMAVFSAAFPLCSSMAIFSMLASLREGAGHLSLSTGDFIAFTSAYGAFSGAMLALSEASLSVLAVVPIFERLKPILTTSPETDATRSYPGKLTGEVELSHVHFRYHEDGPWVVKDLSLKIRAGEFVAFVGSSGCGKSTLLRLMLGFETPATGTIYFDGQDLATLDVRMVRQQMGVVLQESRVLPSDIYRNIIGTASRSLDEAWEAAAMAGLADDVRQMPMGMHTYIPEGGGGLSGGQKQRLLIARAIVNKPRILFLDEATSALDNRTQATVSESMERLQSTRVVIAHRLSTIVKADRICYLQGGEIKELGTYDELMAKNGLFATLAKRQIV